MITRGKRRAERGQWKAVLYAFLFPLLLCACGETGTRFHLEGKFKNINQGEFYLCDFDNGTKDTISLRDGRFIYDTEMPDTACPDPYLSQLFRTADYCHTRRQYQDGR